jgi:hypothetical protein
MIRDDDSLTQAKEAVVTLRRGLDALRADPRTSVAYELLAEGPLDEILKIETEIAEYEQKLTEPAAISRRAS